MKHCKGIYISPLIEKGSNWGKRKRYVHHTYKNISHQKLLRMIRIFLLNYPYDTINKESISMYFNVKIHNVEDCLRELNKEGIISQAKHIRYDSGWVADRYTINKTLCKKFNARKPYEQIEAIFGLKFKYNNNY